MNPPVRTFTLVGIIVFLLLMMHQLPSLSMGDTPLRPVNLLSQLLPPHNQDIVDVVPAPKPPRPMVKVEVNGKTVNFKEIWPKGVEPIIDYSGGKAGGMEHFYEMLAQRNTLDRPVRIAYFGDSYIEGDILTADLREHFQSLFGGNGPGWVDAASNINAGHRRTLSTRSTGLTEHVITQGRFDAAKGGISQRYADVTEGASIQVTASSSYPHAAMWSSSELFLRTNSSVTATWRSGDKQLGQQTFKGSTAVQKMQVAGGTIKSGTWKFTGVGAGTQVFGMALESVKGVILDNFSLRASPGTSLVRIPTNTLTDFNRLRPYDLIILHFGLNVAVSGNPMVSMRDNMRKVKLVVAHLRQAFPQASILIMSVPDHDQRSIEGITTLKEVKQLVSLQQQLAADSHVGFLNFFKAMGGEGSVKKLVDRNMANKDYTHLSYGGGKVVAGRVFPSFEAAYKNYQRRKKMEREAAQ